MPNTTILSETVLSREPGLVFGELDGEVVLLNIETGTYYGMDATGSRIWELLAEPRSLEELVDLLVSEYRIDDADCRQEILPFLQDLIAKGLVRRKP